MPAAPPTQPRPKIGVRFTSLRKSSRFASRASSVGTAMPVTESVKTWSTSPTSMPARASASRIARSPSSRPQRMYASFASPKPRQRAVLLDPEREVPAPNQHVAVDLLDPPRVANAPGPELGERAVQLVLLVGIRGQRAADRSNPHGGPLAASLFLPERIRFGSERGSCSTGDRKRAEGEFLAALAPSIKGSIFGLAAQDLLKLVTEGQISPCRTRSETRSGWRGLPRPVDPGRRQVRRAGLRPPARAVEAGRRRREDRVPETALAVAHFVFISRAMPER